MGAFDKTLEFINSCTLEELTRVLSQYGVKFVEEKSVKWYIPQSTYQRFLCDVVSPPIKKSTLLNYYGVMSRTGNFYSPLNDQANYGNNKFNISQRDAA